MLISGSLVVLSMVLGATVEPAARPPVTSSTTTWEPTPGPPQAEEIPIAATPEKRWYGWELLINDLAFLTLAAKESHSTPLFLTALVGLTLGAPALHFANGNRLMGAVSMGARLSVVGISVALASPSLAGSDCHDDACKDDLRDIVLPVAVLTAGLIFMLVDDLALARVNEPADAASNGPTAARRPRRQPFGPMVAPTRGGATMALVGTF